MKNLQRTLFRATTPYWIDSSLARQEAARLGGRFNRPGRAALYMSFDPITALDEARVLGGPSGLELFAIDVDTAPVFDARDDIQLSRYGTCLSDLADHAWAMAMYRDGMSPTQIFSERVIEAGYSAMIFPSFVASSRIDGINLVVWSCDIVQTEHYPFEMEAWGKH